MNPPKGLCDECRARPAKYWFGQTSVALCGAAECEQANDESWERTVAECEQERRWREEN